MKKTENRERKREGGTLSLVTALIPGKNCESTPTLTDLCLRMIPRASPTHMPTPSTTREFHREFQWSNVVRQAMLPGVRQTWKLYLRNDLIHLPGFCLRILRISPKSCSIAFTGARVCAPLLTVLYHSRTSGSPKSASDPGTDLNPTSVSFFWVLVLRFGMLTCYEGLWKHVCETSFREAAQL